jgi:hypothetical protein
MNGDTGFLLIVTIVGIIVLAFRSAPTIHVHTGTSDRGNDGTRGGGCLPLIVIGIGVMILLLLANHARV